MAMADQSFRTAGVEAVLGGRRIAEAMGLHEGTLDTLYAIGHQQYDRGEHDDAEKTFAVLCLADHRSTRAWLGLGAARQKRGDLGGAITAYSMLAEMGGRDPMAPLHAAECYVAMGMWVEALAGLEAALAWADQADEPDRVLRHVEVLVAAIDQMTEAPNSSEARP